MNLIRYKTGTVNYIDQTLEQALEIGVQQFLNVIFANCVGDLDGFQQRS